jgi:CBS domain containing-hemolysin-like protein
VHGENALTILVAALVASIIASATVTGKAAGKAYAKKNSQKIALACGRLLAVFNRKQNKIKGK